MFDGPRIAQLASLIGDPARANIISSLMDGRALTASELASVAGVGPSTASEHLSKLEQGGLIERRRQGRHCYFALAGYQVADVIEALMGLSERASPKPVRVGPRDAAMRESRICYDHLAGAKGVELFRGLGRRGLLSGGDRPGLTAEGRAALGAMGVAIASLEGGRRPMCLACLDWSERSTHLGGALGAALLGLMIERGWAARRGGRVIHLSPTGERRFAEHFG
ncbi:MAG: winged helix-turn-helix transcriptional regulator [Sphingomonas sp.]|uniref:ArsR/SmtB family transcription factor n=1 Tax=Sphingomonas sp. TaxID=28214 RepID=UPI001832A2C5|nr:winged helix-turn-helix domain-containing protein [Sphingomonas sp.]MBA3668364.1 winged helix-turn-helix transcriptional regulator [Sphingomonas sp.]